MSGSGKKARVISYVAGKWGIRTLKNKKKIKAYTTANEDVPCMGDDNTTWWYKKKGKKVQAKDGITVKCIIL